MFMMIPYQVDVPMSRWPFVNVALIALTVFTFLGHGDERAFLSSLSTLSYESTDDVMRSLQDSDIADYISMFLVGWELKGMFGHVFLHGDVIHLLGNMLFMWVFGNAVCAKVRNWAYPIVYFGLGVFAAGVHLVFDGQPAIGASGAINGLVGMFLVWYPLNTVSCFYLFLIRPGVFNISSYWIIVLWLAFDIWGAVSGSGGVAYWAHLGGLAGGVALGLLLLKVGFVKMTDYESSILDVIRERR